MTIAAPVVPIQLANIVPMKRMSMLTFGVPGKVPLTAMPLAATKQYDKRHVVEEHGFKETEPGFAETVGKSKRNDKNERPDACRHMHILFPPMGVC